MDLVSFFNKWLHLLSIIGTLGGIAFAYMVLVPAARDVESGATDSTAPLWRRFGMVIGALWIVVLLTGFFNYYLVSPHVVGTYHMFVGIKMTLAIIMFLLTLVMAHPLPPLARFQSHRGPLLLLLLVLGVLVVGISAHLNMKRVDGSYIKKSTAPIPAPIVQPGTDSQTAPSG